MIDEKLSEVVQILWELDHNKLVRNVDYVLDLQESLPERQNNDGHSHSKHGHKGLSNNSEYSQYTRVYQIGPDNAQSERPLINYLNLDKILKIPTYKTFLPLLNNYSASTSKEEVLTNEELKEDAAFINAIMNTQLMQYAHEFLFQEEKAPEDINDFKQLLYEIWFEFYSRSATNGIEDSSAFEHVFVGEKRNGKTSLGLHNWIDYFYHQENGKIEYIGYHPEKTLYNDKETTNEPGIVGISYKYDGITKPMGGFLVGVSPEFEIALYTIVFLCGRNKSRLRFGNIEMSIQCFKMERENRTVLATLFPDV